MQEGSEKIIEYGADVDLKSGGIKARTFAYKTGARTTAAMTRALARREGKSAGELDEKKCAKCGKRSSELKNCSRCRLKYCELKPWSVIAY